MATVPRVGPAAGAGVCRSKNGGHRVTAPTPQTRAKWRAAIDQGTFFAPEHVSTLLAALEEAERRADRFEEALDVINMASRLGPETHLDGLIARYAHALGVDPEAREPEDTEP
jgi:hypothetical protein